MNQDEILKGLREVEARLGEAAFEARVQAEVAKRLAEQQPPERRRDMSAARKSRLIETIGKTEYDKIPW
jgi:hypothetical protein